MKKQNYNDWVQVQGGAELTMTNLHSATEPNIRAPLMQSLQPSPRR